MAKRAMKRKSLNLADHRSRLSGRTGSRRPVAAWLAALTALGAGITLLALFQ